MAGNTHSTLRHPQDVKAPGRPLGSKTEPKSKLLGFPLSPSPAISIWLMGFMPHILEENPGPKALNSVGFTSET